MLATHRLAAARPLLEGWCFPLLKQAATLVEHVTAEQPLLLVHPRHNPQHHLEEAHRLATSLYGTSTVIHTLPVGSSRRNRPSPSTYFGRGAVDAIARACRDNIHPRAVIVNAHLSGVQQRNLEAAVGRAVMDRVALIIDIFAQRARTKEAKLQVQLAQLEYAGSRLVRIVDAATGRRRGFGIGGEVEVVSARERGRSGSGSGGLGGAGGGGESELELQGRRLAARRVRLRQELEEVRRTREVQRAGRRRTGMPSIALVGYTNVGKTSLLRALSKKHDIAAAEDKLFATLDATARRIELPSGRPAILSDTVGFISDLPVQLVDAFRATLEEVVEADVLLHVVDASSPQALEQRDAVLRVLRELGMMEDRLKECVIEVWNKTDLLEGEGGVAPSTGHVLKRQAGDGFEGGGLSQGCAFRRVYVSVARNSGFSELRQVIDAVTGGLDPKEWAGQQHATEQGN